MRDAYHIFDTSKTVSTSDTVTDSAYYIDFEVTNVSQSGTQLVVKVASTASVTATAGNLYVILQDSPDNSTYTNLLEFASVSMAAISDAIILHEVPLPISHKRYLKLTYQITALAPDAAAFKSWIESEK